MNIEIFLKEILINIVLTRNQTQIPNAAVQFISRHTTHNYLHSYTSIRKYCILFFSNLLYFLTYLKYSFYQFKTEVIRTSLAEKYYQFWWVRKIIPRIIAQKAEFRNEGIASASNLIKEFRFNDLWVTNQRESSLMLMIAKILAN